MKKVILLVAMAIQVRAVEVLSYQMDAKGYRYKDELRIADARKIAILSYGSLVKQPMGHSGVLLQASSFEPTDIFLPINLSWLSRGKWLTAAIDTTGEPKRIWAASSSYTYLPNACNNLAGREGASYRGPRKGYDLTNIFYMKRLVHTWVMRAPESVRQKIPLLIVQQIAAWADSREYSAVIWASFPPNINSQQEAIDKLLANPELLANTQGYVMNLPEGPQSTLENAIIAGQEALKDLRDAQEKCKDMQADIFL